MSEDKKGWSYKSLFGTAVCIGLGIVGTLIYFNYFLTPEYRKTADHFLKPQTATLIAQLKREKEWVTSSTKLAKRYANKKELVEGIVKYNTAMIFRNAYIEMMIASFDTGFNDVTFKQLDIYREASEKAMKEFSEWVSDPKLYVSDKNENGHHVVVMKHTSFEVLGEVSKVVSDTSFLKESIREQRVKRMIENLRSCQLPGWDERDLFYGP